MFWIRDVKSIAGGLNFQSVKAHSNAPFRHSKLSPPFLEYCSVYWGVHAKRELSEYGRSLALKLLEWQYGQTSTGLLIVQLKHFYVPDLNIFSPFSGLHCASFFGISEVVASLIEWNVMISMKETFRVVDRLHGLLGMDMREW